MHRSKGNGKKHGCGPEADAVGQRVKRVAAEEKFFKEANHEKKCTPVERPLGDLRAVFRETSERISADGRNQPNQQENFAEAKEATEPKLLPECAPPGQSIDSRATLLEPRHDPGG